MFKPGSDHSGALTLMQVLGEACSLSTYSPTRGWIYSTSVLQPISSINSTIIAAELKRLQRPHSDGGLIKKPQSLNRENCFKTKRNLNVYVGSRHRAFISTNSSLHFPGTNSKLNQPFTFTPPQISWRHVASSRNPHDILSKVDYSLYRCTDP